ncbi:hypothetical protein V6N13_017255 [Hibiscus sabdariffa]
MAILFSPYPFPQRILKPCSQPLKTDLFVCLLGGVVLPPKNSVGCFQEDLVRYGDFEGRRRCRDQESEWGSPPNLWCVLGPPSFPASIDSIKHGRSMSSVGNFRPCSLRDVFLYVKEEQPLLASNGAKKG